MTCSEMEPLIIERAGGELAAADATRLDAHLDHCDRCRAEVAAYQEALGLAHLPPHEGRPVHLDASTFAAYQRRRRRRVTGLTIGAGFVAAAVAASVVLAPALLTLRSISSRPPAVHESELVDTADSSYLLASSSDVTVTAEDAAMAAFDEAESP